jgi:UrcA family protein
MKTKKLSGMLLMTLCLTAVGNVMAATPHDGRPQYVVKFADLDLRGPAGISVLYRRIEAAAHGVCDTSGVRELTQVVRSQLCREQAISHAVSILSIPALTSYHMAMTGRGNPTTTVARQP